MSVANAYQFSFDTLEGQKIALSDYKDKVVLVVNTASKCGFTPQYKALQTLYDTYKDKGLVVLGVPSGDFGGQEFGNETEVKEFTNEHFHISFPLTSISKVSGKEAHPFYQWANNKTGILGSPKWNFHKYLIDKKGNLVTWFSTKTSPTSDKIIKAIEEELGK